MEESRLRELVDAFYDTMFAAWQACPLPRPTLKDRQFWTAHCLDLARQVSTAAHEMDAQALRRIHQFAIYQYEYLTPNNKMLGMGRAMREVADMALAAIRIAGAKE